jgi:hypothetical protein
MRITYLAEWRKLDIENKCKIDKKCGRINAAPIALQDGVRQDEIKAPCITLLSGVSNGATS